MTLLLPESGRQQWRFLRVISPSMPDIISERRWDGFGAIVQTLSGVSEDGAWLAFSTGLKVGVRAAEEARETIPILANLILPAGLPWGSRPG